MLSTKRLSGTLKTEDMKRKKAILFLACSCLIAGCTTDSRLDAYFPNQAFSQRQERHNFEANWYGKHLHSMGEPSLLPGLRSQTNSVTWRLTVLPTFNGPSVFRIYLPDNADATLLHKETDGRGGYEAGSITTNRQLSLPSDRLQRLRSLLKELDFWNVPTTDDNCPIAVMDGQRCVLEVADHGRYHVITRNPTGMVVPAVAEQLPKECPRFDLEAFLKFERKYLQVIDEFRDLALSPVTAATASKEAPANGGHGRVVKSAP